MGITYLRPPSSRYFGSISFNKLVYENIQSKDKIIVLSLYQTSTHWPAIVRVWYFEKPCCTTRYKEPRAVRYDERFVDGFWCPLMWNARRLEIQCLISKIDSARLIRPYPQWYRFNRVRVKNVIILVRRIDFCIDDNGEGRKEVWGPVFTWWMSVCM